MADSEQPLKLEMGQLLRAGRKQPSLLNQPTARAVFILRVFGTSHPIQAIHSELL